MTEHFEEHKIDTPRIISEMLLTHILGGERIDLYANVERIATEEERETLRQCVKRTLEHEPVQYIIGKTLFFGMEFEVNSSTLIPRGCTQRLVEQAMHHCNQNENPVRSPRIADIGTGTGCIAITIAANLPTSAITATDISSAALALAQKNAQSHGVEDRISFIQGDGTSPLSDLAPFDIICTNPPYIPDHEMVTLDRNVREWEPTIALSGGLDGMQVAKPIIETAASCLTNKGILLMEIAESTKDLLLEISRSTTTLKDAVILRDQFGDDRFLRAAKA